jgi:hypothetical protein
VALLEQTHGGKLAARILAGARRHGDHGETSVTAALCDAMAGGAFNAEAVAICWGSRDTCRPPMLSHTLVPASLLAVQVEGGCAADYDLLLAAVPGGLS